MTEDRRESRNGDALPVELDEAAIEALRKVLVGCSHEQKDRDILNSLCDMALGSLGLARMVADMRAPVSETATWIELKDKRPEGNAEVLTCSLVGRFVSIRDARYVRSLWAEAQQNNEDCAISHWQPLPEVQK